MEIRAVTTVPRISFVIPVRNDASRLRRCLESIQTNRVEQEIEVIVVDHGSHDGSAAVARSAGARVFTVEGERVAALRNIGASKASGEVLAFVDADHEIVPTWTARALDVLDDENVAVVGALYLPPPSGTWVQRAYGRLRGRPEGRHDVEWLGSGNLVIRRDVFNRLGGFDTSLETCEDVDLCHRVRAFGLRIVSDAGMQTIHYGDPETLRHVFMGELWRGRDNLRVSLRHRLSWQGVPSVVIPIVDSAMLVAVVIGMLMFAQGATAGLLVAVGAFGLILCGASLRITRLMMRESALNARDIAETFVVSLVYDLGRAVSLVARASYRGRRAETARS